MWLSQHQRIFTLQSAQLVIWADGMGFSLNRTWCYRPPEVQRDLWLQGKSHLQSRSRHQSSLANDYNIRIWNTVRQRWELIKDWEQAIPLGDWWETKDEHNVWGGYWDTLHDAAHFERRQTPRKVRI